jgi:DNA gyrase/topoisomerase IV subunit A
MGDAEALERRIYTLERQQDELGSIARQAEEELASLDGIGGFFSQLTGTAHARRKTAEDAIQQANTRLEAVRSELVTLREQLRTHRRQAREAAEAEQKQRAELASGSWLPDPGGLDADQQALRDDLVALMKAKTAARKLREAIDEAVEQNQEQAVRRARNGRKPMFGERLSMVERMSEQFGVLDQVRGMQRRSANRGVQSAMADLNAALERAEVRGWQAHDAPGGAGLSGLLREVLVLSGQVYDRSRFEASDNVERLLELSGMVAMLDDHLDQRLAAGRAELEGH